MTPGELRAALEEQTVPDHLPAFWDDLEDELRAEVPASRRWAGWQVAVSAAAAVIVFGGVAALLIRQVSPDPADSGPFATDPTTTAAVAPGPQTSVPEVVDTSPQDAGVAPWDGPRLARTDVPPALIGEWQLAENQLWCSALYPSSFDTGEATLRRAEFSGGWALAWDLPGLRSAFGIAGTGSPAWDEIGTRMPMTVTYGEQVVGYGGEGFDAAAEQRLAEFAIPGQLCGYQAWSKLGDEHLLSLVDSLRLVEGLEAEPIGDGSIDFGPVERGAAPWASPAVPYPDDYPAVPTETLAIIPTMGVPVGASVRTTTQPLWSLAWDAADGPGHDTLNYPCGSCGRGVVGVTVSSTSAMPDRSPDVRWDDGSVGFILPRIGDSAIPVDRLLFRPPGSADLLPGAVRMEIHIPDYATVVSVWTHLGLDSLAELVDGLRLADPGA